MAVAAMDRASISATEAINGGYLTPATEVDYDDIMPMYHFDSELYNKTVYNGFGKPRPEVELRLGPNITDWPAMIPLQKHALLEVVSVIPDPVTTTDELIPSGDTSSYRSNPIRMSDFTLSRRDPAYVGRAKAVQRQENLRQAGTPDEALQGIFRAVCEKTGYSQDADQLMKETGLGSVVCSNRPGDGSAREQAASCQRVLGGLANICVEYATKRYRSNLVNWGMIPFTWDSDLTERLHCGDRIFLPEIAAAVERCDPAAEGWLIPGDGSAPEKISLSLQGLTSEEAQIILAGCLINYYNTEKN